MSAAPAKETAATQPGTTNSIQKNFVFIIGAVLYCCLGLISGIYLVTSTDSDFKDFDISRDLVENVPKPCGFAVPSTAMLLTGLGLQAFPEVTGYLGSDSYYQREALRGVCELDDEKNSVNYAVARLYSQPYQTWMDAGGSFHSDQASIDEITKQLLCQKSKVREQHWYNMAGANLQDPTLRIWRAYMRAQPAFARYKQQTENGLSSSPCMFDTNPFETDVDSRCKANDDAALITAELYAGAAQTMVCGNAVVGDTVPSLNEMILRLVALSIVADKDREDNNGACFGNIGVGDSRVGALSAKDLCDSVYTTNTNSDCNPADFPTDGQTTGTCGGAPLNCQNRRYPWHKYTYPTSTDPLLSYQCQSLAEQDIDASFDGAQQKHHKYPYETHREFYDVTECKRDDDDNCEMDGNQEIPRYNAANAEREHCYRVHEYSSRSSELLFGMPDIDTAPMPHPVGISTNFGAWLVNITFIPWFLEAREAPYSVMAKSALRDAVIYEGYRIGLSMFLRIPALYAACFWFGRGVVLSIGAVLPVLREVAAGTATQEAKRPPGGFNLVTILAVLVGFLAAIFSRLIDPMAVPESSKTTCNEYVSGRGAGRVFDTTQVDAVRDNTCSILILIASIYAIIWETLLRKPKVTFITTLNLQKLKDLTARLRNTKNPFEKEILKKKISALSLEVARNRLKKILNTQRALEGLILIFVLVLFLLELTFASLVSVNSGLEFRTEIMDSNTNNPQEVLLLVEEDIYFLQALSISHSASLGAMSTFYAISGPSAQQRLTPLFLWLASIVVFIAIGWFRLVHSASVPMDPSGFRGARDALSWVTDAVLLFYAVFIAYKRWNVIRAEIKKTAKTDANKGESEAGKVVDASQKAVKEADNARPFDANDWSRFTSGSSQVNPGDAAPAASFLGDNEYLPLLSVSSMK